MKELKLAELNTRKKLGMVMTAHICKYNPDVQTGLAFTLSMIRDHALGSVWVDPGLENRDDIMRRIKEAADYPILILTDAESGFAPYLIGRHNAVGSTGSEELAYIFGKVTALAARQAGYNVVCNPVLDMVHGPATCGINVRSLGCDKEQVAKLALAEARGMKDGGVLTVGKHYPSCEGGDIDSHMAETMSTATEEELLDYNLYPYLALDRAGLLDGIMTQHRRLVNIDPDHPASLSAKVIDIIRRQGFDGFAITDALCMMGVVAKFGVRACRGLSIANGNDLALIWYDNQEGYDSLVESYEQGVIPDDRLDEAVRRVLEAQHKTLTPPRFTALTQEDLETFARINRESIYARFDEGLSAAISRGGRHLFAVMVRNDIDIADDGKVGVDTMKMPWYDPGKVEKQIDSLFPDSAVSFIHEFPPASQIMHLLERAVDYDDVVFITFTDSQAYVGKEALTSRIVSTIQALQVTDRVCALVHFGNPYVLEEVEHVPRVIIGGLAAESVAAALDVLAGLYPARGVATYDFKLK